MSMNEWMNEYLFLLSEGGYTFMNEKRLHAIYLDNYKHTCSGKWLGFSQWTCRYVGVKFKWPQLLGIWIHFDQILTSRQTQFLITKSNNHKVGINILPNSFSVLNGLIPLSWLNYNIDTYKINIKKILL